MVIVDSFERVIIDGVRTNYFVSKYGIVISLYKNKISRLKEFYTDKGYIYVKLWINNKTRAAFIHRLVATIYVQNPDNKPEVNHKDGIKSHNYDFNLEWVTSKENKLHAKMNNLTNYASGEKSGRSKYTNKEIDLACKLMSENKKTLKEITKITNVDIDTLYTIRSKGTWREISSKYTFPLIQKRNSKTYSESDIRKVCELIEKGISKKDIIEITNVKKSTINDIIHKRRWVHISKEYSI